MSQDDPATDRHMFKPHVLVVEDNVINQKLASALLARLGCEVEIAANGLKALQLLSDTAFDLVFMDCQMPEKDGFETTREIRGGARVLDHNVPIVAMTANGFAQDRDRCINSGMDDYISKPISLRVLQETVERWVPAARHCDSRA
jgi:CheY-like chemotaxis protein